jgi:hypothetical protein
MGKHAVSVMPSVDGQRRHAYHVVKDVEGSTADATAEAVRECLTNLEVVGLSPEAGDLIELSVRFV